MVSPRAQLRFTFQRSKGDESDTDQDGADLDASNGAH